MGFQMTDNPEYPSGWVRVLYERGVFVEKIECAGINSLIYCLSCNGILKTLPCCPGGGRYPHPHDLNRRISIRLFECDFPRLHLVKCRAGFMIQRTGLRVNGRGQCAVHGDPWVAAFSLCIFPPHLGLARHLSVSRGAFLTVGSNESCLLWSWVPGIYPSPSTVWYLVRSKIIAPF